MTRETVRPLLLTRPELRMRVETLTDWLTANPEHFHKAVVETELHYCENLLDSAQTTGYIYMPYRHYTSVYTQIKDGTL